MKIYVKVFASLRKKYPQVNDLKPLILNVKKGISIADLIKTLDLDLDEINLILLNGKKVKTQDTIEIEESIISLFPPIGGGV
ncbi:MAG: MoaD/ThiS family protein [Candidatus Heimdallarchaeaceae archaeon]